MLATGPAAPETAPPLRSDPALAALIGTWRSAGHELIADHHAEFAQLVAHIEPLVRRGRYAAAAAAAQVAANYAVFWHPGLFASTGLENALRSIGEAALPTSAVAVRAPGPRLRVLHVATQVGVIGGHVRMMWRWIRQDDGNLHSVALTRQTDAVPETLRAAVVATGGSLHYVNRRVGGLLEWARVLQSRLAEADLVVLHIHNQDIIPFLALAGMKRTPPVLLLNHADHVFWLGVDFVDLVVSTRQSGHALCQTRRGLAPEHCALLPLSLEPHRRQAPQSDAKRALGLSEDSLVIVTIARAVKFRPIGGLEFPDGLLPLLLEDKRAHLLVVGPGGTVNWSAAESRVPGQILVFGERPDTRQFYEAADVYLDSFPFPSITSLLEAGLHGLPLISRYPFGPGCEIMGADSIGLDADLIRTVNVTETQATIRRLLAELELRAKIGSRTRQNIEAINTGAGWRRALSDLYGHALHMPRRERQLGHRTCFRKDDVDVLLPFVFGTVLERPSSAVRLANATEIGLKTLPPVRRLLAWAGIAWRGEFRFRPASMAWRYLIPEWATVRRRAGLVDPGQCPP